MTLAAALDLGTTRIKGALVGQSGRLGEIVSRPAPSLSGEDPVRESAAEDYLESASAVLDAVLQSAPAGTPLGIASQRSSFVLWDKRTAKPATPLISWQDRRAAPWCDRHRKDEPKITRLTGLLLSPHYAGPKLAWLMEHQPDLRKGMQRGALVFGTLESYLIWNWTAGGFHETDATMAARTLLADARSCTWSRSMLQLFGVPEAAVPRIATTTARSTTLQRGSSLTASIADQASGALLALGDRSDWALVNLGTGGFVLRPTAGTMADRPGYLCGPILGGGTSGNLYALEGTINGASISADRFGPGPTELPAVDPSPEAFCLPDLAGIGSPYWIPERTLSFSSPAASLSDADRRRVVLEGVLFRVREILEDLFAEEPPARVYLSGGLARDPFIAPGLAAGLNRPVELLEETEGTLLGAAYLAAGRPFTGTAASSQTIHPAETGSHLYAKFIRWKRWLRRLLES